MTATDESGAPPRPADRARVVPWPPAASSAAPPSTAPAWSTCRRVYPPDVEASSGMATWRATDSALHAIASPERRPPRIASSRPDGRRPVNVDPSGRCRKLLGNGDGSRNVLQTSICDSPSRPPAGTQKVPAPLQRKHDDALHLSRQGPAPPWPADSPLHLGAHVVRDDRSRCRRRHRLAVAGSGGGGRCGRQLRGVADGTRRPPDRARPLGIVGEPPARLDVLVDGAGVGDRPRQRLGDRPPARAVAV